MTLRICIAIFLAVYLPEVAMFPLPPPVPPIPPLDVGGLFLLLERFLRSVEHIINAELDLAAAALEAALAAADAAIRVAAHGLAAGANATAAAASECSQTASTELHDVLGQFEVVAEKCIAEDLDQLRTAYESLELDASNARSALASAGGKASSCVTNGEIFPGITTCLRMVFLNTVADVSEAMSGVHRNLAQVIMLTAAFPKRSQLCIDIASARTASAFAAVFDDILACVATASPQAIS